MEAEFRYGRETLQVRVPRGAVVYRSQFPPAAPSAADAVLEAVRNPVAGPGLGQALQGRRPGEVVVVVSDITRPVPYARFLPQLLRQVEEAGVPREQIVILVATGMHRPCTPQEFREMFGPDVTQTYRILNHDPRNPEELAQVPGRTWAGSKVCLNRHFVEAGFRMVTGLVEPHFMAGFSGGRKAVCPGVASMETIRRFHGHEFMGHPDARNGLLHGNPCHEESLSVAQIVGVDFALNVVLDDDRELVRAFAGDLEGAHRAACRFAGQCTCRPVQRPADLLITSSGGYPLDATFYQSVKGFVSCLPAIRPEGRIIAFGGCSEGIGSDAYAGLMRRYAGRWQQFLEDIRWPNVFTRDQWQFQMHCRTLAKVGVENLHFVTDGLDQRELSQLNVTPHSVPRGAVEETVQDLLDELLEPDDLVAVLPEGPYCAPVPAEKPAEHTP